MLRRSRLLLTAVAGLTALSGAVAFGVTSGGASSVSSARPTARSSKKVKANTPIDHLVVIFGENISFDHYFGTYPNATNASGQKFTPRPGTPHVNGLTPALLNNNPNGVNPRR